MPKVTEVRLVSATNQSELQSKTIECSPAQIAQLLSADRYNGGIVNGLVQLLSHGGFEQIRIAIQDLHSNKPNKVLRESDYKRKEKRARELLNDGDGDGVNMLLHSKISLASIENNLAPDEWKYIQTRYGTTLIHKDFERTQNEQGPIKSQNLELVLQEYLQTYFESRSRHNKLFLESLSLTRYMYSENESQRYRKKI